MNKNQTPKFLFFIVQLVRRVLSENILDQEIAIVPTQKVNFGKLKMVEAFK